MNLSESPAKKAASSGVKGEIYWSGYGILKRKHCGFWKIRVCHSLIIRVRMIFA